MSKDTLCAEPCDLAHCKRQPLKAIDTFTFLFFALKLHRHELQSIESTLLSRELVSSCRLTAIAVSGKSVPGVPVNNLPPFAIVTQSHCDLTMHENPFLCTIETFFVTFPLARVTEVSLVRGCSGHQNGHCYSNHFDRRQEQSVQCFQCFRSFLFGLSMYRVCNQI